MLTIIIGQCYFSSYSLFQWFISIEGLEENGLQVLLFQPMKKTKK